MSVELRVTFMGESFIDSRMVARHFKRRVAINVYIWPLSKQRTIIFAQHSLYDVIAASGRKQINIEQGERQKRPAKIPLL